MIEKENIKSGPKCPQCGIKGIKFISSEDGEEKSQDYERWFNVAFCNQCGHIHGIFAKTVFLATSDVKKLKGI